MKVLITGGAGFIGSHIAEHFCNFPADELVEVVVLDNFRSGHQRNLEALPNRQRVRLIEGSITDAKLLLQEFRGVDYVFHLAAMISVPESLQRPIECVELNVHGTLNVLEAARQNGVKKVVLSSSAAIYGDEPTLPKLETMRPEPKTPYGVTKLDGEYYLEMYRQQYGLGTTSLRYFNVYGPRQDPKSQYAAAVPIFIHRAVTGDGITIFGDGQQTRDFVYVKDVVAANVLAAITPEMHGVYNVAGGKVITIKELAESIVGRVAQLGGPSSTIAYADPRPGDIKDSWSDTSKIRACGFVPGMDLSGGIAETIRFFAPQLVG